MINKTKIIKKILNETDLLVSIEASETDFWKNILAKRIKFWNKSFGKSAPYKDIYDNFELNIESITKKLNKKIMKIKIGINGMGRIGRMIIRSIIENNYSNIEIKHINNRT